MYPLVISRSDSARSDLVGGHVEQATELRGDDERHGERHDSDAREHHEHRAQDLVQRVALTPGPILRDELHERTAVPQIEDREVHRDRRGQRPQPVRQRPQVGDVEGHHQDTDRRIHADGDVASGQVARHQLERPVPGTPDTRLVRSAHCAPFPERITFTVSNTMVRSKKIDMCLM